MGSVFFRETACGTSMRDTFNKLCNEAECYYGHQEGYNGTISTTSISKTIKLSDKYSESVKKKAYKQIDKDADNICKRNCWAYDLGVMEYHIKSVKKVTHSDNPPKYAMKYCVVIVKDFMHESIKASYDTKKEADDYALSLLMENPNLNIEVRKQYIKICGDSVTTTFKIETKKYKTKPKNIPKGCKLEEVHFYIFVGWAAE